MKTLERNLHQVALVENHESLLGYEGTAAAAYFRSFKTFLPNGFVFSGRKHHPPPDPVNALLSLGYTLLYNNIYAQINVVGLDPYCGFFHQPKHGHATLASDILEEFRYLIDILVVSTLNLKVIKPKDFRKTKQGIRLTKKGLNRFLKQYDKKMNTQISHPKLDIQTTYQRCLELQVRHLARVIMDEEPRYIPFKAK